MCDLGQHPAFGLELLNLLQPRKMLRRIDSGEGQTVPAGVTGKVTTVSSTPPLTPVPRLQVFVLIDGQLAKVAFAGEAPGLVSGIMQINAEVPSTARSGNVPIQVWMGTSKSPAVVTVAVK
jgi:uncharacterized protein (TIGR03437 family)